MRGGNNAIPFFFGVDVDIGVEVEVGTSTAITGSVGAGVDVTAAAGVVVGVVFLIARGTMRGCFVVVVVVLVSICFVLSTYHLCLFIITSILIHNI